MGGGPGRRAPIVVAQPIAVKDFTRYPDIKEPYGSLRLISDRAATLSTMTTGSGSIMSFSDDLEKQLVDSWKLDAQRAEASEMSLQAALRSLERLQKTLLEAAAFLSSHDVLTNPFITEHVKKSFWSAPKTTQETLGQGWFLRQYSLSISDDGHLWQTASRYQEGMQLQQIAPFDFETIRETLTLGRTVMAPLGHYRLVFPRVDWDDMRGRFVGNDGEPVNIVENHKDFSARSLEVVISSSVVELVKGHSD